MRKEIWKPIDFGKYANEGYEVSNLARVRSYKISSFRNSNAPRILEQRSQIRSHNRGARDNGPTYLTVGLTKNSKRRNTYVHRLVARAFVPNPENKKYVNHKDGDSQNNLPENLEWCTAKENALHSHHVLGKEAKYLSNGGPSSRKAVLQISKKTGKVIKEFSSGSEASKALGLQRSAIGRVCRGGRKSAGGYFWRFKDENK